MPKSGPSKAAFDPEVMVTAAVVGEFLEMTKERVRQLAEEGIIPREGRGRFPLRSCIRAYIAWSRDEARKTTKSASASRVSDARAREIELRVAEREHRLIDTEEALAVLDEILGTLKSDAAGLPARITRDIDQRRKIETEIDDLFRRASNRFAERASALRESGEAGIAQPEDDA